MHLVVIGAQWGDEGKGKIVDYLASEADLVVRFSGGANAGHTIVTNDITYKLHLVPSGIVYPEKHVVLGSGMVIDPEALFSELATIKEQGVDWEGRVHISDRAHLVLPDYKEIDKTTDAKRRNPIGTTGRGIGIAYAQKANRDGIRVGDLTEANFLKSLRDNEREFLAPYIEKLNSMSINLAAYMVKYDEKRVLFEGAQGALLDLDIGTYPFVSSGYSAAAGASMGGGVGPRKIDRVMGVFKAYTTRVGNGPFPSEFDPKTEGALENMVREIGREYGVTTGRPRRCGYLDLVALRYACRTNSIDSLVLTHLDVYDTLDEIGVCVGYELDGKTITDFPSTASALDRIKPVVKSFPGWKKTLTKVAKYEDLPEKAKTYIAFIEEFTKTNVDIVSVGYNRDETMIRKDMWTRS
ncbi:adenylosuccinate synthase [Sediminispirochaeta smaragdinae]|jgi:adenylosuccinate synthase|uniref:Adenylosuccinate synthetase n=1 Tax=Sediminispirochaeta smaragdinae (strain DSM 11293 / JCM 15392 / SEBR 4228) TaxID=573413 RepID=E1R398_SEDSS|nr:adenylosuccinate synthase [Sediminispirochaeta smaragdinae]ADK81529.1 adenylosuccinate synthetase [Sediminispirochaeta smaragdinae DSM 11293]